MALSFGSECVAALLFARATRLDVELQLMTRVMPTKTSVVPTTHIPEQNTGHGSGPASCEEAPGVRGRERRLLIATRVAHEELGEKCAAILGCALAQWLGGLSSASAARSVALIVIEAVSDVLKTSAWAAHAKVDVANVHFTFHWPTLLSVACSGASTWCCLSTALRIDCLVRL